MTDETRSLWDAIGERAPDRVRAALASGASAGALAPAGHTAVHQVIQQAVTLEEALRGRQKTPPRMSAEQNIISTLALLRVMAEHDPCCIDIHDIVGETPLLLAVRKMEGDALRRVVEFLLAAGADPSLRDRYGKGLDEAAVESEPAVKALLLAAGWRSLGIRHYTLENVSRPELLPHLFVGALPDHERRENTMTREVTYHVWLTDDEGRVASLLLRQAGKPARLRKLKKGV